MSQDFRKLLARSAQLSGLASATIALLLGVVAMLVYALSAEVGLQELGLLRNHFFRVLAGGLVLMIALYFIDAHIRLRGRLQTVHDELEDTRSRVSRSCARRDCVTQIGEDLADLRNLDVIDAVLGTATEAYDLDGTATIIGDDVSVFVKDEYHRTSLRHVALTGALDAVRKGALTLRQGNDGSSAVIMPLRVKGRLNSVVVAWRKDRPFQEDEQQDLTLLARVIEFGTENRHLIMEARRSLRGTLSLLTTLIEDRQVGYSGHSRRVAELATAVGGHLGLGPELMEDLRLASIAHDLGMLRTDTERAGEVGATEEPEFENHPTVGAELAKRAGLSTEIQVALATHHERADGSGFPEGRSGADIPLLARIIAVCDTFDAMTSCRPGSDPSSRTDALLFLIDNSPVKFDATVVGALAKVLANDMGASISTSARGRVRVMT